MNLRRADRLWHLRDVRALRSEEILSHAGFSAATAAGAAHGLVESAIVNDAPSQLVTLNGHGSTCVLLCGESSPHRHAARGWLATRGLSATESSHPLDAMSALCVLERSQSARAAWGLPRATSAALLIATPEESADLRDLRAAVGRFLPRANVWTWPDVRDREGAPTHDATVRAAIEQPIASARRIERADRDGPVAEPDSHELTRREIAMLLELDDEPEPHA